MLPIHASWQVPWEGKALLQSRDRLEWQIKPRKGPRSPPAPLCHSCYGLKGSVRLSSLPPEYSGPRSPSPTLLIATTSEHSKWLMGLRAHGDSGSEAKEASLAQLPSWIIQIWEALSLPLGPQAQTRNWIQMLKSAQNQFRVWVLWDWAPSLIQFSTPHNTHQLNTT